MTDADPTVPVSVILPTFRRPTRTLETLAAVLACAPPPAEVIVHVDAGDAETAIAIRGRFPAVRVLLADTPQGPGGGRNRLLQAAEHEIVVSLDDDSFPVDTDFFTAVGAAFAARPQAGILAMQIIHDHEPMIHRSPGASEVADFVGCGCAYRRSAFLATQGYLPLHPAYGMEEADLALQIVDAGWRIVHINDLRVRHATDRSHQAKPEVVAAHLSNTLLLAYLRYPLRYALLGLAQYLNRMRYSLVRGQVRGVLWGLVQTPTQLRRHGALRRPVKANTIVLLRALRTRALRVPPSLTEWPLPQP